MTRSVIMAACATALLCASPHLASAQIGLGPIVGAATAHVGGASGTDGQGTTLATGFSVAVVEEGGWGAEFDAGFAFGDGRTGGLEGQSYIMSVAAVWPKGRLRPFGVAGAGALRARTCSAGCASSSVWTDWAAAGGGGLYYIVNETFGVRGDVRYLSTVGNHPDPARSVQFWRFGVGATFIWSAE
jgi:hypothetical protein